MKRNGVLILKIISPGLAKCTRPCPPDVKRQFRNRLGSFVERETGKTIKYSKANARQIKEEVAEDGEFAGDYATGEAGQWRNKGPKAHKPATIGDLVGENFINTDVQAVVSE